MHKLKKIGALLLALAMLLSLSACGSFESRMAKAVKKMNDAKSMHMDMDMTISMAMSVFGQSMDMDMDMAMAMDMQKEPMAAKMEMSLSTLGMSQNILFYMEEADGGYVMYMSEDGGSTWSKQDLEEKDAKSQMSALEGVQLFMDCADSFQEVGEEDVRGSAAWRYDGVIEGKYIARALEMTGANEMLEELLGDALNSQNLENLDGIPTSIWIDKKSGMISRYDMDMTELMSAMTANLMDGLMGDYGLDGVGMDMVISSVKTSVYLSNFNQIGEILIPDAARAA